jgi:hypothetical protein
MVSCREETTIGLRIFVRRETSRFRCRWALCFEGRQILEFLISLLLALMLQNATVLEQRVGLRRAYDTSQLTMAKGIYASTPESLVCGARDLTGLV